MEEEIVREITGREKIKPSSPTPPHKRIYSLSWLDQISPRLFIPILLFFNKPNDDNLDITTLLKTSLSETLTEYYPFAGTIRDRESILCDDRGVDFIEAKINSNLSSILNNPKKEALDVLFPDGLQWRYAGTRTDLLTVQLSRFDCGALALAACLSHKVSDAASLVSFLAAWASTARDDTSSSSFQAMKMDGASVFPRGDLPLLPESTSRLDRDVIFPTRRFVFGAEEIGSLKRVVSGCGTRVEVVTALLFGAAVRASEKAGVSGPRVLQHQVNLRARTVPRLPENAMGNMGWFFPVAAPAGVGQMREALTEFCSRYAERFRGDKDVGDWCLPMKENLEKSKSMMGRAGQVYVCTSWCRFPVYGIDFGWGDPVWTTTVGALDKNVFVLMDRKSGDGIEAIVTLEEKEMRLFECDQELLQFASCSA